MARKDIRSHLSSYLFSIVLALLKWGYTRTRNIAAFWREQRKKPPADRQKVDRYKAAAGLLAIALGLGLAAWFAIGFLAAGFAACAAAFFTRQHALYVGAALLLIGLGIARLLPKRRKLGLLLAVVGALFAAFGLGYLG